ncbi:hypothetical protein BU17DRAFT_91436 [Hysterangium stoloniferum]|nr:hypothetical protein BU17DRAFT_91436 [Hysterangium stoloniferum]
MTIRNRIDSFSVAPSLDLVMKGEVAHAAQHGGRLTSLEKDLCAALRDAREKVALYKEKKAVIQDHIRLAKQEDSVNIPSIWAGTDHTLEVIHDVEWKLPGIRSQLLELRKVYDLGRRRRHMGRTKGVKNKEGHKAGGARKGSGRKPKAVDDHTVHRVGIVIEDPSRKLQVLPREIPDVPGPSEGHEAAMHVPTTRNAIERHHVNHSYTPSPHISPIILPNVSHTSSLPIYSPLSNISQLPDSYYSTWTGAHHESTISTNSLAHPAHFTPYEGQGSTFLSTDPSQHQPSLDHESITSSDTPIQSPMYTPSIDDSHYFPSPEPAYLPDFPVSSDTFEELGMERMSSYKQNYSEATIPSLSCTDTLSSLPIPRSEQFLPQVVPTGTRPNLIHIAPAPFPQDTQTSPFPYPLPAAPGNRYAILCHSKTPRRRRRRCAVCVLVGKEDVSYECPGRGDRTRCPFSRQEMDRGGTSISNGSKRREHSPKASIDDKPLNISEPEPFVNVLHETVISSPTHINHLFNNPTTQPAGVPVETTGRRPRHCMVCISRGQTGTICPGRGNRTLCPFLKDPAIQTF